MKLKTPFLLAISGASQLASPHAAPCDNTTDAATLLRNVIDSIGGTKALQDVQRLVFKAEG